MIQERFTTPAPVRLELKLTSGEVEIATTEAGEATVTVQGPDKLLETTTVELTGDRLLIEQRRRPFGGSFRDWGDRSLRVWVHVPRRSRVEIVGESIDATIDGTIGELEVKTAAGDIRVNGIVEGDATVKTVSGDVRLPDVTGDVHVRSVSGDLSAGAVGGSVTARSVSGSVRIRSVREGEVTVQSVSGDVEVGVAPGADLDVDAASASGELTSEVPLSSTPSAGGGPRVVVRSKTVSGDFRVIRAE
jgi:DUF4097 and DUF4098 domain-containing protein YvlB